MSNKDGSVTIEALLDKKDVEEGIKSVKNDFNNLDKAIDLDKISTKLTKVGKTMTTAFTLPIAGLIGAGVTYNAEIEKYQTSLTTLMGSEKEAQKVIKQIQEDAAKTPFDVKGLTQGNQLLISTGLSAEESRETILALGDAVSATGGGNEELARMAVNLQQIKNTGKATSLDIKQFAFAGIDIYGLLADYTGKTRQEVMEMEVSWDSLNGALIKASKQGGKYFGAMEKQSETVNGKISTLKDSFQRFTGQLAKNLIPTVKKVLDKVNTWMDKFDKLDDGTKDLIVKIALLVAGIGPLLTIVGKVVKVFKTAKDITSKVSEAFSSISKSGKSATESTTKLKSAFSAVGVAITGAVIAYEAYKMMDEYYKNKAKEQVKSINEVTDAVKSSNEAWLENRKSQEESVNGGIAQLDNLQNLKNELDNLVDANGRVQEKDKARAQFIINQLNEALGTEIELNGNVIKSYDKVSDSIDKVIDAKKREMLMNAFEERYNDAIANKSKYYDEWQQSINATAEAQEHLNNVDKEVAEDFSGWKTLLIGVGNTYIDTKNKTEEYTKAVENAQNAQNDAKAKYEQSIADITAYSKAFALNENQNYEDLQLLYQETSSIHNTATQSQIETLANALPQIITELNLYKEAYKTNGEETAKTSMDNQQKILDNAVNTIVEETNKTKELTPDLVKAWKTLGENSADDYNTALSKVDPATKDAIQAIVDISNADTSVAAAGEQIGKDYADGVPKGLNNSQSKSNINFATAGIGTLMLDVLKQKLGINSPSRFTEQYGIYFLQGINRGVSNSGTLSGIYGKIRSIGQTMLSRIKSSLGIGSPSKYTKEDAMWFIKGLVVGINQNENEAYSAVSDMGEGLTESFSNSFDANAINNRIEQLYKTMQSTIDFETNKLSSNLTSTQSSNRNFIIDMNIKQGDIYLDREKVGRSVAPTVANTIRRGGA